MNEFFNRLGVGIGCLYLSQQLCRLGYPAGLAGLDYKLGGGMTYKDPTFDAVVALEARRLRLIERGIVRVGK